MNKIKGFFASFAKWCKSLVIATDDKEPKLLSAVKSESSKSVMASVIAAFFGLFIGLIIMFIVNPDNAFAGFYKLLQGGIQYGARGTGNTLYYATPILMTGLSVGFAFKTGLFNIGATGQFMMGMFFSLVTGYFISDSWVVCLIAGFIGGMLWGFIPGLFKALFNVSEVITSIMTNYICVYLIDMLITNSATMYDKVFNRTVAMSTSTNIPKWGMDVLFERSYANGGIIIAIVIAIIVYILMNKTKLGYEIKACGINRDAAKYAGINQNSRIILAMVIAGGLAGLGGALYIQAGAGNYYTPANSLRDEGFNGIAVALLGVSNPIGTIFAALFFAHVQLGGSSLQGVGFSQDIVDIIVGVIIYFSAFALIFKDGIAKLFNLKTKKQTVKENANQEDTGGVIAEITDSGDEITREDSDDSDDLKITEEVGE